ncbi:MAG: DMT family transporter [Rhodospirillales bacterium]|nr:DMT family transporter [Rhodospirillales bacterium]
MKITQVIQPTEGPGAIGYRRGVFFVLMSGVCFSIMGLAIRYIEIANVWQILFYRSLSLTPLLFIIITLRSGNHPILAIRKTGPAGIIGGLALVIAFSGGIYSIQATTVANAMFLFASAPFFAALLGYFILRESVRKATWVSMIFATAGICFMVWEGISLGYLAGNLAAIASALGFAIFTVALRWKKLDDTMPTVFLAGVFAFIVSGTICMIQGNPLVVPANDIAIALALGIFQVGAGLTLYTIGSKSVPAAELTVLSMTEVVLGPVWVWLAFGETAGIYTLLGGMVLLGAIVGNALSGLRRKPTPII